MPPVGAPESMSAKTCHYEAADMVVWSGAGNTLRVPECLAKAARSQGAVAHVLSSTSDVETHATSRSLLGLLVPTHGFAAPLVHPNPDHANNRPSRCSACMSGRWRR
jgi:hypothetical protein